MTVFLTNRDGNGKTNEEGHYRLLSKVLQGQVLGTTDLQVVENTTPGLSVIVKQGDYRLQVATYAYTGWLDADSTVTISTPDPTNPRVTTIVIYIDKQAATSPAPPNNPGIAKLMAVNGAASSNPTAPTNSAIQSAVGNGNPFMILAEVEVGAGASAITNSNITDLRTEITLNEEILSPNTLLAQVGPLLYPIGTVYENANVSTNPADLFGFGTWVSLGAGRVTVGIDPSDPDFSLLGATPGTKSELLLNSHMPIHSHKVNPPSVGTSGAGNHTHKIMIASSNAGSGTGGDIRGANVPSNILSNHNTTDAGNHAHSVNIPEFNSGTSGGNQPHNNIQPSIVVYRWKRTA